jgi:hypothetical protein
VTRLAAAIFTCFAIVLATASAASAAADIEVVAGAVNQNVTLTNVAGVQVYTASASTPHQIGADNIEAFLDAGTDVKIDSSADNDGTGLISVNAAISSAGSGKLTMDAPTASDPVPGAPFPPAIAQTAPITVAGNVICTTNNNMDVTLDNAANDFNNISVPQAGGQQITDVDDLVMGTFDSNGIIRINAGGTVTQTGPTDSVGVVIFTVGPTNDVFFTNADNNPGAVRFASVRNASVVENEVVFLTASNVSGGSNITGTLNVTSGGAISDGGGAGLPPLTVAGATTLTAPAGSDITLDDPTNNFNSVGVTSGNNVTLADANALALASSLINGSLTVNTAGAVTQPATDALTVFGTTTVAAGAANNVTLSNALNNLSTLTIASAKDVSVTDSNALAFGASSISGTLTASASGLTQTGALAVTGAATFTASSAGNVTLTSPLNNFSTVAIASANDVSVTDATALILGASSISGALTVNTAGSVTQTGALAVTGAATFTAGAANDITLNLANGFSTVAIGSGRDVVVTDSNALAFGSSSISGALTVNTAGSVTQTGALAVTGAATFTAGAGNNITLNLANGFSTVAIGSGNDVVVTDANALTLGPSTISGALTVNTAGSVTQTGALAVTEAAIFTAGAANDVTLNLANNFSTVAIGSGRDVSVTDANALTLGASTVSGNLALSAPGALAQSGAATVSGSTALGGAPVTFDNAASNFGGAVALESTGGSAAAVSDVDDLFLDSSDSDGALTATAGDDLAVSAGATIAAIGVLRLVSDHANPSAPSMGTGGITAGAGSALSGAGAIRLYGARRADNSIDPTATFNGSPFNPGTIFVNSAREQWGVYSPAGIATAPFTFFYKNTDASVPDVTITAPANGATYERGQVVSAAYSCTDGGGGSGVASCTGPVANGSPIDTSTVGQKTFQVDVASGSGGTGSKTATYTVVEPPTPPDTTKPTITLTSPTGGAKYTLGQQVFVDYACADQTSLVSCKGTVADGARLDTGSLGAKAFSVEAVDAAGNTATASRSYTVVLPEGPCQGSLLRNGTSAADSLTGTATGDLIYGGDGDDVITGRAGVDCLFGEAANDRLFGNEERDWLWGGPGQDRLFGKAGPDRLRGEADDDYLSGGDDDDGLKGGPGRDTLRGQAGDDYLSGGDGDDRLSGGAGTNSYFGREGDDVVYAQNATAESVHCGRGADRAYLDEADEAFGCERVRRAD